MFNLIDHVPVSRLISFFSSPGVSARKSFDAGNKRLYGEYLYIATPEDIVLSKLEWAKLGKSSRQIEDAAGILKVRADELDVPYIEKWVTELGLTSEWASAREAAGLE